MRRWIAFAVAVPVLLTAVTLISVARNRAGGRAPIVLSERELSVPRPNDDNTAASAGLMWHSPPWPQLDPQELRALPRRGYVVMTLAGPPPELVSTLPLRDAAQWSRLVVIDADVNAGVLERRYPDGRTHLIAAATLRPLSGEPMSRSLVLSVEPARLHIPAGIARDLRPGTPFAAEVRYGANYEPWITRIDVRQASPTRTAQ